MLYARGRGVIKMKSLLTIVNVSLRPKMYMVELQGNSLLGDLLKKQTIDLNNEELYSDNLKSETIEKHQELVTEKQTVLYSGICISYCTFNVPLISVFLEFSSWNKFSPRKECQAHLLHFFCWKRNEPRMYAWV